MSPEQQRIAIAEACGAQWFLVPGNGKPFGQRKFLVFAKFYNLDGTCDLIPATGNEPLTNFEYMWREGCIPDYLNDLNAMHEAEGDFNLRQSEEYFNALCDVVTAKGYRFIHSATAAQRAEAFLRTIGKWK